MPCASFAIVFAVMFWWWSDVIVESRKYHTAVVQLGLRYGMILFIASEVLFFAAFFWAFFDASLYPNSPEMPVRTEADGGIWPNGVSSNDSRLTQSVKPRKPSAGGPKCGS